MRWFLDRGKGRALLRLAAALAAACPAAPACGLPAGGQVAAGRAAIVAAPGRVTVDQASTRAVIDWESFDLAAGEAVRFHQPSGSAITLVRIRAGRASEIAGRIAADGRVWLVNRHGVAFGPGARVDVVGLVATSADLADDRFLAGDYRFDIPGDPHATIVNAGRIATAAGGTVTLVAPRVINGGAAAGRGGDPGGR